MENSFFRISLQDLWFKVRKDICETPSGKIIDPYYVYEFPEWVTALPLTEENKVIWLDSIVIL